MLAKGAIWNSNCRNPAKRTPHARAITGISIFGATSHAEPIKLKLKIRGVNAGIENLL